MASIVLILSHPLVGRREATVRTHLVGQSSYLWNVGGHGLGIPTLKGFSLIIVSGLGETESAPDGNRLAILLGVSRGSGETDSAPDGDRPATPLGVSRGSGAACLGRNRTDITFQGAPFEVTCVGSRNGHTVVL